MSYNGFYINEYKFETKSIEETRVTQNSGIATVGDHGHIWYGILLDIIELQFIKGDPIHVFKCLWYDMSSKGLSVDDYNFMSVNTTKTSFEDEPFILTTQAQQVYYSKDPLKEEWSVVSRWKPRDIYEVSNEEDCNGHLKEALENGSDVDDDDEVLKAIEPCIPFNGVPECPHVNWVRKRLGVLHIKKKEVNKAISKSKKVFNVFVLFILHLCMERNSMFFTCKFLITKNFILFCKEMPPKSKLSIKKKVPSTLGDVMSL